MGQRGIGLIFLLLGLGIVAAAPAVSLECTRAQAPQATCHLSVIGFGVIPYTNLDVPGVVGAVESSMTGREARSSSETDTTTTYHQLVLGTTSGEFRTVWLARHSNGGSAGVTLVDLPPFGEIVTDINQLLEYGRKGETAVYRAVTWTPLLVGSGFALFGLLALVPFASFKAR
jgi:hypothetical protein